MPPANIDKAEASKAAHSQMLVASESMRESDGSALVKTTIKQKWRGTQHLEN